MVRKKPVVVAIENQKGGVGKTTIAFNLSHALHEMNYKVLAIDLDPQGNLSDLLGGSSDNILGIFKRNPILIIDSVNRTSQDSFCYIPSNKLLKEIVKNPKPSYDNKLKQAIDNNNREWDFIIIDCNPSLNILTTNVFIASDYLVVVAIPDKHSLIGYNELIEEVREINKNIEVLGILFNQYHSNVNAERNVIKAMYDKYPDLVFDAIIPFTSKFKDVQGLRVPIFKYKKSRNISRQPIMNFVYEFLNKLND